MLVSHATGCPAFPFQLLLLFAPVSCTNPQAMPEHPKSRAATAERGWQASPPLCRCATRSRGSALRALAWNNSGFRVPTAFAETSYYSVPYLSLHISPCISIAKAVEGWI